MSAPEEPVTVSEKTGRVTSDPTHAFESDVTPAAKLAPIDENKDLDKDLPPAEVTPARISNLPTTNDAAPAVSDALDTHASDPEIEDLGWSEDPKTPIPLLRGLNNEQLWLLVRRFDQQIYEVRAIENHPDGRLDLNISDDEEFSPDKLRATLERVYISVGVPIVAAAKHIARLRSWNEYRRTMYFCITYFTAWTLDLLVPISLLTLLILILSPRARYQLFPPAPLAAISTTKGTIQTPPSAPSSDDNRDGVVVAHPDSKDSLTGAPEAYSGQAVEQEASNFVAELGALAVGSVTGQGSHPSGADVADSQSGTPTKEPPSPTELVSSANIVRSPSTAKDPARRDKTKAPVQAAVWTKASPVMHMLSDLADTFERFGNAVSPTPPFSQYKSRIRLVLVILPLFPLSFFVSAWMVWKGFTFAIGIGMFGQPMFDRISISGIIEWLDQHYPHWRTAIQLRNSILRGVPTNAQLTLTMLRIGEANKAPLPPPPPPSHAPPLPPESDSEVGANEEEKKKHKGSAFISMVKGTTKAGIESALGFNRVKASVGSEKSKARVGVVQPPEPSVTTTPEGKQKLRYPSRQDGPVYFGARYRGKKGSLVISTSATTPVVGFELPPAGRLSKSDKSEARRPIWSIPIEDIKGLRKVGGLGWRSKLLVGWSMGDEVVDGIEITDVTGRKFVVTAMRRRDEAFNRLLAMGNQSWESW